MKLGNAVEKIARPIAQVLNLPCHDETGQLKPESGCAKRRNTLNNFGDAVYEHFFPRNNNQKGPNQMQFAVNLSVIVETETPEEALEQAKAGKGKTVNFSVNPRPAQPARPTPIHSIQQLTGAQLRPPVVQTRP
jgi:hypothetical protein